MVRTSGFHPENPSSILGGVAKSKSRVLQHSLKISRDPEKEQKNEL